jgi:hypothetical protein
VKVIALKETNPGTAVGITAHQLNRVNEDHRAYKILILIAGIEYQNHSATCGEFGLDRGLIFNAPASDMSAERERFSPNQGHKDSRNAQIYRQDGRFGVCGSIPFRFFRQVTRLAACRTGQYI